MPDTPATLFCRSALLQEGWRDDVRLTLQHCPIAIPGLPNVHSHAFQRALAGLAERRGATADSFWTWREVMYRFLDRLTPDDVAAIAAQAYAEMLESGFTRVGEFHYLHHTASGAPYANPAEMAEQIAAAAAQTGIGLTLLPCFYAQGGFGAAPPATGQRPVAWLLDHAAVDARWCLIHATHMTEAETAALAATGVVAGLCPLTEASLGDGIFPAAAFLGAGGRFGIGTDSNIQIDAAAELRQLEYGQRLRHRARNVLAAGPDSSTGRTLFQAVLRGGAQALGQPTAGLGPGAPADIVVLDPDHPSLAGRTGDALLDAWVFAAARPPIASVWRGGRQVVRNGRHIAAEPIAARYTACLRRLLS
jgi:cytosine/adenosine deaminase-related metal-dependent hydrolase